MDYELSAYNRRSNLRNAGRYEPIPVRFPRFFGGWVIWRRLARVER